MRWSIRAKFVPTPFAARQLVSHGHVKVNGKRVTIASYLVREGDVLELTAKAKDMALVIEASKSAERDVAGLHRSRPQQDDGQIPAHAETGGCALRRADGAAPHRGILFALSDASIAMMRRPRDRSRGLLRLGSRPMSYMIYGDLGSGAFSTEAALAEAGADYEFQPSRSKRTSRRARIPGHQSQRQDAGAEAAGRRDHHRIRGDPARDRRTPSRSRPAAAAWRASRGREAYRWIVFMASRNLSDGGDLRLSRALRAEGRIAEALREKARGRESANGFWCWSARSPGRGCCRRAFRRPTSTSPCSPAGAAGIGKEWLAEGHIPKIMALAEAVAQRPKIAPVWKRHFPQRLTAIPISSSVRAGRMAMVSRRAIIGGAARRRPCWRGSAIAPGTAACSRHGQATCLRAVARLEGRAGRRARQPLHAGDSGRQSARHPALAVRRIEARRSRYSRIAPAIWAAWIRFAARCIWDLAARSRTSRWRRWRRARRPDM